MSFIGHIKKMSYGLIKIVPKDKNGNPIADVLKTQIDFDPSKPGIQEGKEWLAIIEYFKSFKDSDGNGLNEVPEKYKQATTVFVPLQK
jgi:5'-nucleotidase